MHSPFYRSGWDSYSPRYFYYTPRHPQPQPEPEPEPEPEPIPSPVMRGVPVHRPQPTQSSKRKIVSIPVHGPGPVGGGKQTLSESESESAVRIQKALRGYVVRKWVRRVVEIKREVEDVERRMGDAEVVDKIARDERERLKFNETLMSLLFKLDSVRGVDPAVRDFRRAVIRKAVALQESLDKIPPNADDLVSHDVVSDVADSESNRGGEEEESADPDLSQPCADEAGEMENADAAQDGVDECDDRTESQVDSSRNPGEEEEERRREKMLENRKMMRMMGELFERNEKQTSLLSTLSERVEQLEKAYACEKLRRIQKKKGKKRNASLDGAS